MGLRPTRIDKVGGKHVVRWDLVIYIHHCYFGRIALGKEAVAAQLSRIPGRLLSMCHFDIIVRLCCAILASNSLSPPKNDVTKHLSHDPPVLCWGFSSRCPERRWPVANSAAGALNMLTDTCQIFQVSWSTPDGEAWICGLFPSRVFFGIPFARPSLVLAVESSAGWHNVKMMIRPKTPRLRNMISTLDIELRALC